MCTTRTLMYVSKNKKEIKTIKTDKLTMEKQSVQNKGQMLLAIELQREQHNKHTHRTEQQQQIANE